MHFPTLRINFHIEKLAVMLKDMSQPFNLKYFKRVFIMLNVKQSSIKYHF